MKPEPRSRQLSFAELTAGFAAAGIEEMPEGVGELTHREMRFVLRMLEHGQMAQAAREAGYSEQSAGVIASETLRKPKVHRFYRRCLTDVASKSALITRRVYERSVVLHARAIECAQRVQDANAWLLNTYREETGKNAKDVREYELARDRAQRDERHYVTLANQTDGLLATLLGKLTLTEDGKGGFTAGVVYDDTAREQLLKLQREGVPMNFALEETAA